MNWDILLAVLAAVGGVSGIVGFATFWLTRKAMTKKADAEAESAAVEPLKTAIELLNQQLLDCNSRYSTACEERDIARAEAADLKIKAVTLCTVMCIHAACPLRDPTRGMGARWYEDHQHELNLGCDHKTLELLLSEHAIQL